VALDAPAVPAGSAASTGAAGAVDASASPSPRPAAGSRTAPDLSGPPPLLEASARPQDGSWARPAALAAGGVALASAGVAVWQGAIAAQARSDAASLLLPDGTLRPGADPAAYDAAADRFAASRRNAWVAGATAVALAATSAVLWLVFDEPPAPGGPAIRF